MSPSCDVGIKPYAKGFELAKYMWYNRGSMSSGSSSHSEDEADMVIL